jgi:N,N'-diacetyllegionaminate synthase
MKKIQIDKKFISNSDPCFIIAEIGTGYRNFEEAKLLIDSAKEIGADAIKIQTFKAETITSKKNFLDLEETGHVSQYQLFKKLEISEEIQLKIVNYAKKIGIIIFSAPSHMDDLISMKKMNLSINKIGSDLACHLPLLQEISKQNKPIILSTGMCTLEEIKKSVEIIKSAGNNQIMLLHCISDYPAKLENSNLKCINMLKEEFDVPVGFSDHSIGISISLAAATMGANIIEKHFRDEQNTSSPDDVHALTKKEFSELIKSIRNMEKMRGTGIKTPTKSEMENRLTSRVSIIAMTDIKKGSKITNEMIDIRRPGTGLAPEKFSQIIGKSVLRDIQKHQPLKSEDVEEKC